MKRGGYIKRKVGLKTRIPLKRSTKPLRRTKIRVVGKSDASELKREIQALLREGVMIRDGGCFLRFFDEEITPQYRSCGPTKANGDMVLQAEHLHSRSNMSSFADLRLVVCCCQRHHIFYKPQHSAEYNSFARKFIGPERAKLWDRVAADHRPYKVDLKLAKIALEQDIARLKSI